MSPQKLDSAPYGYCPSCGAKGVSRERRPDGNDRCENGHEYPSRLALSPNRLLLGDPDWFAPDGERVPVMIHPNVREELRSLLVRDPACHAVVTRENIDG